MTCVVETAHYIHVRKLNTRIFMKLLNMQPLWVVVLLGAALFVAELEAPNAGDSCSGVDTCSGMSKCDEGVCVCAPGYSGTTCEDPPICSPDSGKCRNGGTCDINSNPYKCSCATGYSGPQCETGNGTGHETILAPTLLLSLVISVLL